MKSGLSRRLVWVLVALQPALACSNELDSGSLWDIRGEGSSSVPIIENLGPVFELGSWVVSDNPAFRIGGGPAKTGSPLFRVQDVARSSAGAIVVADGGSQSLRWFDGNGNEIKAFGGPGDGPGEFRWLSAVQVLGGDSIVAFDFSNKRLTLFDSAGNVARTEQLDGSPALLFLGRTTDGSILGIEGRSAHPRHSIGNTGAFLETSQIIRFSPGGTPLDTLATFPSAEVLISGDEGSRSVRSLPFGRRGYASVLRDEVALGYNDRYELRVLSFDGILRRVVRKPQQSLPVTRRQKQAYLGNRKTRSRGPRPGAFDGAFVFPRTHGCFSIVMGDLLGNLWVQDYRTPGFDGPSSWSVFDSDGLWLADVLLPADLRVFEIGDDYLLGLWRDELDAEFIVGYELRRKAPTPSTPPLSIPSGSRDG